VIRQFLRSRAVVFTEADEVAYCDMLVSRQPGIRFVREVSTSEAWAEAKPEVQPHMRVHDVGSDRVDILFTYDGWSLKLEREQRKSGRESWGFADHSWTFPNGYWWWIKGGKPASRLRLPDGRVVEYISGSDIVFRARASQPDELRLIESLLRPIAKLTTRQMQLFELSAPEKPSVVCNTPDRYWVGHHAVAWARESPDRYLACQKLGDGRVFGWRPLE